MHIRHLLGVEIREVERGESFAFNEHITHIRHILGVKIFDALYFGQIIAAREPVITARGSCVGKRSIEDHCLDFFPLGIIPPWIVNSRVKVISSCGLGSSASESKRSCAFVKLGIRMECAFRSEVASLVVGVIVVALTSVVFYGTDEIDAHMEHIITRSNLVRNKLIADEDGCESVAAHEHIPHIRHLRCVEAGEVEQGES